MPSSDAIKAMTWLITVASLCGTVLNVRKSVWCFYIWTFGNAAWLLYDLHVGIYSRAVLDFIHFCLAIWGIVEWRKKKE